MKKIKINKILPIVAVVAAVGAAIVPAHKSGAQGSSDPNSYHWFLPDGTSDGVRSRSEEISLRGCNGTNNVCARGYSDDQLIDVSHPELGPQNQTNFTYELKKNN